MTKKEYIRCAMHLCPSRREWRELVEKAIRAGCIDYEGAENYIQVYPLGVAITERLTGYYLNGSWNPAVRRWTRREANNIKCFI